MGENQDGTLSPEAGWLLSGIHVCNRVVHQAAASREDRRGMGSTISVLFFNERTLVAANVGDSPIFLIQNGSIELLSEPHTVAAEHRAIDPEGAGRLGAEFRHVLTRAIGTDESVAANICEVPHFKNDILVMCSDGLSDIVSEQEIMETVQRQPPQAACEALVNLANDRGGIDNITVIVVKVLKSGGNNSGIKNLLNRFKERIKRFGSGQGLAN
jgi:protein phosphatase